MGSPAAKRILIVDDEPHIRRLLKARLEYHNFEVHEGEDGESAIRLMKELKPDLAIIDVGMPKMDGYTFVKVFKSRYSMEEVPIVVLTGRSGMQEPFEMEGVRSFITKPCNGDELVGKIRSILRR